MHHLQLCVRYTEKYLNESIEIIRQVDASKIEKMAMLLATVKEDGGRIFFLSFVNIFLLPM